MPRQQLITVPAVIRKADIAITAALMGKANSRSFAITRTLYAPGCVIYVAFGGALQADGRYAGEHRFREAQAQGPDDGTPLADFDQLSHLGEEPIAADPEPKPAEHVETDDAAAAESQPPGDADGSHAHV